MSTSQTDHQNATATVTVTQGTATPVVTCDSTNSKSLCSVGNNANTMSISKLCISLVTMLLLGTAGASPVHAPAIIRRDAVDGGEAVTYNVSTVEDALSHSFVTFGANNNTNASYFISDSMMFVTDITYPSNATATNMEKRFNANNAPLGTWFHQWQTARNGYWDTAWTPASGCYWTGLGEGGDYQIGWSQAQSLTVSAGFNFGFAESVQASWGIQITKTESQSGSYTCHVTTDKQVGRIFTSKGMAWHDQQRQKCVRRNYGKHGLHCDSWGPYMHGDMPTKYGFNLGCSTGRSDAWC